VPDSRIVSGISFHTVGAACRHGSLDTHMSMNSACLAAMPAVTAVTVVTCLSWVKLQNIVIAMLSLVCWPVTW